MVGEKSMKCVILVDKVVMNSKPTTQEDELLGIKGYCMDYGGDNYIARPIPPSDEAEKEKLQLCNCGDIQGWLID